MYFFQVFTNLCCSAIIRPAKEVRGLSSSWLFRIVSAGNTEALLKPLSVGLDVDRTDEYGRSMLHYATFYEHFDIVKVLTGHGGNLHCVDEEGRTPLHNAIIVGNVEICVHLLERGAKVDICDSRGETPVHHASKLISSDCLRLLIKHGATVDSRDRDGKSPLHHSVICKSIANSKVLVDNHCKLDARDLFGKTPLDYAKAHGPSDLYRFLVSKGAFATTPKCDSLNACNAKRIVARQTTFLSDCVTTKVVQNFETESETGSKIRRPEKTREHGR